MTLRFWLAKKDRKRNGQDLEHARALTKAALDIMREPENARTVHAVRAALRAAYGQDFSVKRDDVLKMLLALAVFFSNEARR